MNYGKAIEIIATIQDEKWTDGDRIEAIDKILSMETINAVKKDWLENAVRWLRKQIDLA